jgi:guanidinobutyrase / D-arginase
LSVFEQRRDAAPTMWSTLLRAVLAGVPGTGGLTSREMLTLVRGVTSRGLIGLDMVEVAPTLGPTNVTASVATRIGLDALAFHARSRR